MSPFHPRMTRIVLGSSSKWRQALFAEHFPGENEFLNPDIDEKAIRHQDPRVMVKMIARAKLDVLIPKAGENGFLVCCDQVVTFNGEVREKPEESEKAKEFLRSYRSGCPAVCVNGIVVMNLCTKRVVSAVDTSKVFFQPFDDNVIDRVVARGEVLATAGGIVVEDIDLAQFVRVEGVEGSVPGLPVSVIRGLVGEATRPKIRQCIFDMDGLLLDTETSYTVAQKEICARYGKEFSWELKAKMMGTKSSDAGQIAVNELGLPMSGDEFIAERALLLEGLFRKADVLPGVLSLLNELKRRSIPICVATSSTRSHFELKSERHKEMFALFNHIVTGDDVVNGKPHPEIFLKALDMFGNGGIPEESLVFEDSPLGIDAGMDGRFRTVMVPDENLDPLKRKGDQIILSLEDFDFDYWF